MFHSVPVKEITTVDDIKKKKCQTQNSTTVANREEGNKVQGAAGLAGQPQWSCAPPAGMTLRGPRYGWTDFLGPKKSFPTLRLMFPLLRKGAKQINDEILTVNPHSSRHGWGKP